MDSPRNNVSIPARRWRFAQQNKVMAGQDEFARTTLGLLVFLKHLPLCIVCAGVQHFRWVIRIAFAKHKIILETAKTIVRLFASFLCVICLRFLPDRSINTFRRFQKDTKVQLPPQRFLKRTPHRSASHCICIAAAQSVRCGSERLAWGVVGLRRAAHLKPLPP